MKGLLLKDWYAIKSNFKSFFLLIIVFVIFSAWGSRNSFMLYYPCIVAGLMIVSLISYEEKEKWHIYASVLPYKRSVIVSEKYILSLILSVSIIVCISSAQAVGMLKDGIFSLEALSEILFTLIPMSTLPPAFLMPFVYKFGAEKGRIAYIVVLAVSCTVLMSLGGLEKLGTLQMYGSYLSIAMSVLSAILFAASWFLSVKIYNKREL